MTQARTERVRNAELRDKLFQTFAQMADHMDKTDTGAIGRCHAEQAA